MKSRMEKYNQNNITELSRSNKNKELYSKLYDIDYYQPDSNITVLANSNEINLSSINELVDTREDYQRVLKYKNLVDSDDVLVEETKHNNINKAYDINEMLEVAKNNAIPKEADRYKKLEDTEYNILKGVSLNELSNDTARPTTQTTTPEAEKELRELIHTITTKKLIDEDLLEELKGGENTEIVQKPNIIEEIKKDPEFFTNSLTFSKKDFEENGENIEKKKKNIFMKIFVSIISVLFLVGIFFLLSHYLKIDITPW